MPWQAWLWWAALGLIASQLWFLAASGESMTARHWTLFSATDGPPSSDVRTLLVDGPSIWVGTASGVARYDGRWTSYSSLLGAGAGLVRNALTLPFGQATALTGDEQSHQLWAGTRDGHIAEWSGSTWRAVAKLAAPVQALIFHDGELWAGTERGLLRMSPGGDISALPGEEIEVRTLAHTAARIWVGSRHGLQELDPVVGEIRQVPLQNQLGETLSGSVDAIWVENDDLIWLGMGHWLVGYRPSTGDVSTYLPFDSLTAQITGLAGIPGKEIWVTSNGGVAVNYLLRRNEVTDART